MRPLLVESCQKCHGADKQQGGLRLDSRAAVLKGGDTGAAIVLGKPNESLLVDAIRYGETYQMPPKSQLPAESIAALVDWVERGVAPGMSITVSAGEKSLPLCSYPTYPKYVSGPATSASSYQCSQR